MPEKRHWSSALAAGLANLAGRLDERHARVTARDAEDDRERALREEPFEAPYDPGDASGPSAHERALGQPAPAVPVSVPAAAAEPVPAAAQDTAPPVRSRV